MKFSQITKNILKPLSLMLITSFLSMFISQLMAFDLPNDKVEELRVKYEAKIEDGILKIKDRNMIYNASEELLTRAYEDKNVKIEAIFQPFEQINNRMNFLLSKGLLDETTFFDRLYGKDGIFAKYYNKNDYLYFAFRIKDKSGKKIDTEKFIKNVKIYDGLDTKANGEKPKFFHYDEKKKARVYEDKTWDSLPGFEDSGFIWVAFPKKDIKEEAGVYYIEINKFGKAKGIQFLWTLPIKFPVCRCK
jgi:hypothetical protein